VLAVLPSGSEEPMRDLATELGLEVEFWQN
jgi:hypothetical protein